MSASAARSALAQVLPDWLLSAGSDAKKGDKAPSVAAEDAAVAGTVFALAVFEKLYAAKKAEW